MASINFPSKNSKRPLSLLFLFLFTLSIYKLIYPQPRNWYNHYYYLAQSFSQGKLDTPSLPDYYHDRTIHQGKTYLPFPPTPAIVLLPSLLTNISQQQTSIIIGSINTVLTQLLLGSLPLSLFFAFGTVHFWSSVIGTTWYFAHIVSIFFLLLALLTHRSSQKLSPLFSGLFLGLATLSRLPVIAGSIFFFLQLKKCPHKLILFCIGLAPPVFLYLLYNYLRFDSPLKSGYLEVYKYYTHSNIPYTFFHSILPDFPHFHYLDPRNIPLHLFTSLLLPPIFQNHRLLPSPYGLGLIFTSPLLFLTFKPKFKNATEKHSYLATLSIAAIDFLHFSQGWVQFGYRFLLDFLPFLLIVLSYRFKPKKILYFLLIFSVLANTWGTITGIKLGW